MKTKLLLSILLFYAFYQSNAQNGLQTMKILSADYENQSAQDSLETKYSFGLQNIVEKTTLTSQTKLPYPVIFIHGLNSSKSTWSWDTTASELMTPFGLTYGGRFDVNLNYDDNPTTSNLTTDTYLYNSTPTTFEGGDIYYVNFAVDSGGIINTNSDGTIANSCSNLSNQSAIAKQGYALKQIIYRVMQLTVRDKVVLMGHSMGGLASREYLQNTNNWQNDGLPHVAKLATTGTPHGGSNALGGQIFGVNYSSEAIRDLKKLSVYLEGGYESSVNASYLNSDVNCNGISNDGLNVLGLNQRDLFSDVDYSCVIGTALSIDGDGGDGAVTVTSANLNNANSSYSNITQNIFSVNKIHTQLTGDWYSIMQAIDEPNNFPVAYEIGVNNIYYGFISEQSTQCSYYPTDFDDYKFSISSNSNVSISLNTSIPFYLNARIMSNDQTTQIGTTHNSNGSSNITFTQNNLPAGNYFLEIYGIPSSNTITQYNFNISKTSTPVSPVVISQVYGGGGNSGASYTNDYIELFNRGTIAQNLDGWSVQYVPATAPTAGLTWFTIPLPNFTLQPGQYFLIKCAAGTTASAALPLEDAIDTTITLSSTAGKVILVSNTTPETSVNPTGSQIIDKVGYGTTPNGYEGTGPTGTLLSNTTAAFRKLNGCTDTDNNTNDFTVGTPSPRNSASPINLCSSLSVSQNTLETVTLYPNPTNSIVFFDNTNSNFKEVSIYNYLGQELAKTIFNSSIQNQEIDMTGLSAGVYILKFSNSEISKSVKIIKE
jgi:pimeloyl-ACP methyl ester carboxylesterase